MKRFGCLLAALSLLMPAKATITNAYGRDALSLNGHWNIIVDQYDQGRKMKIYENSTPQRPEEFYEYSFFGGQRLTVPGDWNSQMEELKRYEGTIWYGRHFNTEKTQGRRKILYFGGVNYLTNVYLNGEWIGAHEGGFTPFEIDVTDKVKDGDNFLVVEVNNTRNESAIPAMAFDWWNYGGITRDVMLLNVAENYVKDYFVRLRPGTTDTIDIDVAMAEEKPGVKISVAIPELGTTSEATTDARGRVKMALRSSKITRWQPGNPYLYDVIIAGGNDCVKEKIGFRNIETRGTEIFVNGKPQFMRSISFHEEIPQRMGRAFSEADAVMLLNEALELGVNMVRTAHYPQNEHIVRQAEKMGIILWEEIPVWQGINFTDSATLRKAKTMLTEMIERDKNRCAVGFWSIANETKPSPERDSFLSELLETGKEIDETRLYTAAFDIVYFDEEKGKFTMEDPFAETLDVIGVNKYMGWYAPWPVTPDKAEWEVMPSKPLIITEFGGEALYGQNGSSDETSSWSEDYQARLYYDNLEMMKHIPNLVGVSPWILFDFRSPYRFHPTNQEGWNRKGLVSDRGQRKRAWYIMKDFYESKKNEK